MFVHDLLAGKRILVTGGGTGLGRAMVQRFLELGAQAAICGRRADVLAKTKEELESATGGSVETYVCDVRESDAVEAMIAALWERGPLDVLVNNAAGNFISRTEDLSPRAVEAVLRIVLHGTVNVTLACGKRWLAAKHPATVLSISTTYARSGSGFVVPSAMAKAGVDAMTKSLAAEWGGRGIRFVGIAPGPFKTEGAFSRLMPLERLEKSALARVPLGRFGDLGELADLAAYLVSDRAAYINGDIITIDGGESLAGAGEFNGLGAAISDAEWEMLKPRKAPPSRP
jgi:NAD(P)-dependent dehydrogenase (short-subunit alcohol dehydrogenase family)